MLYNLFIKPSARKEWDGIPAKVRVRIGVALEELRNNPRPSGVKKLKGREDVYRIRIGNFRVLYTIDDYEKMIRILSVQDRKDAYR